MEANGEPIYGHLPPGVAPAADASKEATYFNFSCRTGQDAHVKALGAKWLPTVHMYYVPAGLSLAPFAEWLTGAAENHNQPTWIEYDMHTMPERQKDVKALGGRFDPARRRWYIPPGLSLAPFQEYLRPLGADDRTSRSTCATSLRSASRSKRWAASLTGSVSAGMCRLARALRHLLSGCLRMSGAAYVYGCRWAGRAGSVNNQSRVCTVVAET